MNSWSVVVILGCVICCSQVVARAQPVASPAPAQSSTDATVQAKADQWFRSAWKQAVEPASVLKNAHLLIGTEVPVSVSQEELARLRAEVAGHPDHPRRGELEAQERRLAAGVDKTEQTLAWGGPERWRFSTTILYLPRVGFADSARNGDEAWILTPEQLTVISASGKNVGNYTETVTAAQFREPLGFLLHGGLGEAPQTDLSPKEVRVESGRFHAMAATSDDRMGFEYAGLWDAELGRGFVESRVCVRAPNRDYVGERIEFSDWTLHADLGAWIAGSVQRKKPNGALDATWRLVEARAASVDEIRKAVATPPADGEDSVRGRTTFTKVYDTRLNKTIAAEAFSGFVPTSSSLAADESSVRFRWIGWGAALLIVACLAYLRLRRLWATRDKHRSERTVS